MGRDRVGEDWAAWMSGRGAVVEPPAGEQPVEASARVPAAHDGRIAGTTSAAGTVGASASSVPDDPPSAAGRPGSARREATRQRVLDAAREVFAERGVIGGTVEDICERAGFTRGAFYSNFTDKDDVLAAVIEREHARLLEHLDASLALVDREVAEATDLGAALSSIVDQILRSVPVDRQLSLVQTELEIHAIRRPELARPLIEANVRFRARIAAFIDDALARHGLELTVDTADVVDAAVAVVERSVRRALLAGGDADPDAMARKTLPGLLLSVARPRAG
ncbi:MAG: TetR/AcrR family transcriptional regulator [Candidatus Limnocylindrales bacterium]